MAQQTTKKWHKTSYPAIDPRRPELSVSGKNVIITGGGSVIGRAMSFSFAAARASSITLMGPFQEDVRQAAAEVKVEHPSVKILYEAVDITDRDQVVAVLDRIVSMVGELSILVCNVGDMPQLADAFLVTHEQFHYACDVNTWACMNMIRCFEPRCTQGATIINVGGAFAHIPPMHKMSVHYFTKLAGLMEHLATENPDLHIVNMHPGVIQTLVDRDSVDGPDIHFEDPSLPADFTVWLASSEASFLKGKIVWANWDLVIRRTVLPNIGIS
ncbi:nad(p)-binding protein [Fusarium flagelliforme]|uniref:Nad(P)-binding protein n=1 Tax=Fusarium flagelliforme TaxID=2675880 RepID=A0A395N3S4_9HYPO|nr:nad(p)-binding protein [Fusarium flagelliforme]